MDDLACKVLVIGGGPGGYVTAIRAAQHGMDTILVEQDRLGGTCLNVGCIPSKALIHAAEAFHDLADDKGMARLGITLGQPRIDLTKTMAWKDGIVRRLNGGVGSLLKKNSARTVLGRAECIDGKTWQVTGNDGVFRITAEHVVIATGSEPVELKALPFGKSIVSSTDLLSLSEVPRRLVVIGAGYIGLELGTAFAKLGSEVTLVEAAQQILPGFDAELGKPVFKRLGALGVNVMTGAMAQGLDSAGGSVSVKLASGDQVSVPAEIVLVAAGRRPSLSGFGLEKLQLAMNGPFLRIDARCATSMHNVWAVGDVTGEPMLAHRAMAQGEVIADIIAGHRRNFDKVAIPAVCFTDPEIVAVGLLPDDARKTGHDIEVGLFPFAANGRAMTKQSEDGFVRVVARADNHLVLGLQAVGHGVSEMSAAFSLALEMGACLEDIAGTIQAHPTQGEAFQEAALAAAGQALHI